MSEEYLARESSDLFWFAIVGGLAILIMIAGHITARKKSGEERETYIKRFAWACICLLAGYFFLTVPYTGYFFNFGSKLEMVETIENPEQGNKFLKDHHRRLETLERELTETRDELRELRDHYGRLLQNLMIAVFIVGFSKILTFSKPKPDEESRLNLSDHDE